MKIFPLNIPFIKLQKKEGKKPENPNIESIRKVLKYPKYFGEIGTNKSGHKIYKSGCSLAEFNNKNMLYDLISSLHALDIEAVYGLNSPISSVSQFYEVLEEYGIKTHKYNHMDYEAVKKSVNDIDNENGNILICCDTGSGRSANMAAYYLVMKKGMNFNEAEKAINHCTSLPDARNHYCKEVKQKVMANSSNNLHASIMYFHNLGEREAVNEGRFSRHKLIDSGAILDGD